MMSAAFFSVLAIIFVMTFIPKFTRKTGVQMNVKCWLSLLVIRSPSLEPIHNSREDIITKTNSVTSHGIYHTVLH
jgi:hypothetical protein